MLIHTAQEKLAICKEMTSALLSNLPYLTDFTMSDPSKLWTLKGGTQW